MTWPHGGGSQSSVEVHGPIQADQRSSFVRVIITGANSGVGRASAAVLASAGHDVVIACRNPVKGKEATDRTVHRENAESHPLSEAVEPTPGTPAVGLGVRCRASASS